VQQIVRTNPELVTALVRQLARMVTRDDKVQRSGSARPLGPYRPLGKPFVRPPALEISQEPRDVDAPPSS
jgi:hypothetical protein